MNIGGGNSTDDPIEYRKLVPAYQSGERKYGNEHRTEKHFEARDPPSLLHALYPDKLFPSPAVWDDANNYPPGFLMRCVFYAYTWPPRLLHRGTILQLPIRFSGRLMAKGH